MPRCAEPGCARWRPERLAPRWTTGMRFNGEWYCSRACVESAAREGLEVPAVPQPSNRALRHLRIGVLLRHMGSISETQLNEALQSQRTSGRRLGQELQQLGIATSDVLVRALAAQGSVSYLTTFDVERVKRGPAWLPSATVRALGVVPFETVDATRSVKVVCAAPVPRSALRALKTLTGWDAEPYLVDDTVWERALDAYRPGQGATEQEHGETHTVRGVADAAAWVADAAQSRRAVTMRSVRAGDYTVVRVEAPSIMSDLLIAG
jgi:Type II secretion system (T2SS), protein E, N-terminal domain